MTPLMALIDHSLAPEVALLDGWPSGRPSAFNLLFHLSGVDERVPPLLVELPASTEGKRKAISYLLKKCNGRPMSSILSSPLPSRR
jgi:hypothetical protein